jgi:protein-L-isoaspartate(D-aspartate) O-methyltransferase
LLYELTQVVDGLTVVGVDISAYALEHAKEEIRGNLQPGNAKSLPFDDDSFDLVISLNTLHNLPCFDMLTALQEMERVGRKHKYLVVESYRNEQEKVNLMYWVLTGECFFSGPEWEWFFDLADYSGDHSFIYFE